MSAELVCEPQIRITRWDVEATIGNFAVCGRKVGPRIRGERP